MKFLAVMLLFVLGRYRYQPEWACKLGEKYLIPHSSRGWALVFAVLLITEYWLLQSNGLFWTGLILIIEVILLYLLLPHWSPFDLSGDYYNHWCRGDYEAAYIGLSQRVSLPGSAELTDFRSVHYTVCQKYLSQSLAGFFSLLFWFFFLGIPGAFFALWGVRKPQSTISRSILSRLARFVCWLPASVLGFSFFVVGNGRGAYERLWRKPDQNDDDWLLGVALGAIGDKHHPQTDLSDQLSDDEFRLHAADEIRSLVILVRRSAVLWVVLFGLLTMTGIESPLY